ncbi:MAG: hypothetical protein HZR80_01555 [Candidatus Heimdallarchaeota archaeon]
MSLRYNDLNEPHDEDIDYRMCIAPENLFYTVCWLDTPNWSIRPFFSQLQRLAVSGRSQDGYYRITINRDDFDSTISNYFARELRRFEQQMAKQGKNAREELVAEFDKLFDKAVKEGEE